MPVVVTVGGGDKNTADRAEEEKDAEASTTAHETDNGGESGVAAAAVVNQAHVSGNTTRQLRDEFKCNVNGCKLGMRPLPMDDCAASVLDGKNKCHRKVHAACFEGIVMKRDKQKKIDPAALYDPNGGLYGKVFCKLGCYDAFMKSSTPGTGWGNDGKDGPNDPNCSENLLVKLFLSSDTHYGEFRRPPKGKTKLGLCNEWAKVINSKGVVKKRSGKDVENKIERIEKQMKLAHDWATSKTGAGVKDGTIFGNFDECVTAKCKFYFELLPVFVARAGMQPLALTDDILASSTDDDDEDSRSDDSDDVGGNNSDVIVLLSGEDDSNSQESDSGDEQRNKESNSAENEGDDDVDFGNNEVGGFLSSDEEHGKDESNNNDDDDGSSSSAQQKERSKSNTKQKKKKKKNRTGSSTKSSDGNSNKKQTPKPPKPPKPPKGSAFDEKLDTLISLKLEEAQYRKRKHEREEEKYKRRKLEDYDLTDPDQFVEFAAKFEAVKQTVGGDPVRAALQFPKFADTALLTEEEK